MAGPAGGGVPRRRAAGIGCLLFRYGGSAGNGRRRGPGRRARRPHGCVFKSVSLCACAEHFRAFTVQLVRYSCTRRPHSTATGPVRKTRGFSVKARPRAATQQHRKSCHPTTHSYVLAFRRRTCVPTVHLTRNVVFDSIANSATRVHVNLELSALSSLHSSKVPDQHQKP